MADYGMRNADGGIMIWNTDRTENHGLKNGEI